MPLSVIAFAAGYFCADGIRLFVRQAVFTQVTGLPTCACLMIRYLSVLVQVSTNFPDFSFVLFSLSLEKIGDCF